MLRLKKVAITGSIASGKSTVAKFFKDHNAYVVSADEIAHKLLESDPEIQNKIIKIFGSDILSNGKPDRKKLACIVFNDKSKLKSLENITHPSILHEILQHYESAKKAQVYQLFIVEVPLLYEAGFNTLFDIVIAVQAPQKTCQTRFGNPEEWIKRMSNFSPENYSKAQFVIHNDGSMSELKNQVQQIVNVLSQGASR